MRPLAARVSWRFSPQVPWQRDWLQRHDESPRFMHALNHCHITSFTVQSHSDAPPLVDQRYRTILGNTCRDRTSKQASKQGSYLLASSKFEVVTWLLDRSLDRSRSSASKTRAGKIVMARCKDGAPCVRHLNTGYTWSRLLAACNGDPLRPSVSGFGQPSCWSMQVL